MEGKKYGTGSSFFAHHFLPSVFCRRLLRLRKLAHACAFPFRRTSRLRHAEPTAFELKLGTQSALPAVGWLGNRRVHTYEVQTDLTTMTRIDTNERKAKPVSAPRAVPHGSERSSVIRVNLCHSWLIFKAGQLHSRTESAGMPGRSRPNAIVTLNRHCLARLVRHSRRNR